MAYEPIYTKEKLSCHDIIKDSCIENINKYKMYHDPFGITRSNKGGYHSHEFVDNERCDILTSGLIDHFWYTNWITEVYARVEEFIGQYNPKFKPKKNLSFWINVNYKNNFNDMHNHIGDYVCDFGYERFIYLSGVYYLKKPKNSGNLFFTPPSNLIYLNHIFNYEFLKEIEAESGDLILFFPHENHYVEANASNEDRVSISFNMYIDQVD